MGGRIVVWLSLSVLVLVADQLTKLAVTENLVLYQRIPVLPFFDLVRLHNTGAAFSFLASASGWQNTLFMVVAGLVSVVLIWWLATLPGSGRNLLALGLALVLGGAIGNLIDRALYGYVVDFLLFYYRDWSYPAFNVADSAITCGVALILFDGFVLERGRQKKKKPPAR
jgi:signal peptidase II